MTIDVSTPEARQDILDDWDGAKLPRPVVNAAFARIAELEALAHGFSTMLDRVVYPHLPAETHGAVDVRKEVRLALDRARAAGVLP